MADISATIELVHYFSTMKYLAVLLVILASASFTTVSAIQTSQTPTPITVGTPTPTVNRNTDYELIKQKNRPKEDEILQAKLNKALIAANIDPLYRLPTDAELSSVAIDPEIRSIFASFLSRPNTGIFRMEPDLGCAEVIGMKSPAGECLKYPIPGAGNAFSFRLPGYRMRSVSDLSFAGAKFIAPGALTQGIMVKLGDVPIDNLDLKSNGVAFLSEYQPASEFKKVETASIGFDVGTEVGGFRYVSSAPVEMNMTYALRSVAYRGEVLQSFQGVVFNELDYDKRGDVIVVFRTVGFDKTGTLLIIWQELRNIESPKLKLKK